MKKKILGQISRRSIASSRIVFPVYKSISPPGEPESFPAVSGITYENRLLFSSWDFRCESFSTRFTTRIFRRNSNINRINRTIQEHVPTTRERRRVRKIQDGITSERFPWAGLLSPWPFRRFLRFSADSPPPVFSGRTSVTTTSWRTNIRRENPVFVIYTNPRDSVDNRTRGDWLRA